MLNVYYLNQWNLKTLLHFFLFLFNNKFGFVHPVWLTVLPGEMKEEWLNSLVNVPLCYMTKRWHYRNYFNFCILMRFNFQKGSPVYETCFSHATVLEVRWQVSRRQKVAAANTRLLSRTRRQEKSMKTEGLLEKDLWEN